MLIQRQRQFCPVSLHSERKAAVSCYIRDSSTARCAQLSWIRRLKTGEGHNLPEMLRLQFTPATAFSIASTSAPMSRPSVAEPSAGEAFLQEALSSLLRQRLYSPGPRTSRMPAARASLGVMLPEGHPDPLIIILRVTLEFA